MQIATEEEVLARIARAARARPNGIVATDADGTLWSGDVGEDSFHAFIARGRIERSAHEAMQREARAHGFDPGGSPAELAQRLFDAYAAGTFPEERACEMMAWCYAEWTKGELSAFMRDVVARRGLAARLHAELGRVLAGVRALGVELYVVSASPRAIVEEGARIVGVEPPFVVAADPRFEGDTIKADVHRPIPYGPGKVHHLERTIGRRPILAAFGDNVFDVPMLQAAEIAVAVRPKPRLRARAAEVSHLVELSPGAR